MRRALASVLIGLAAGSAALGQGHIILSNYVSPYNAQILWSPSNPVPITESYGFTFQVFYAEGVIIDPNLLQPGVTFGVNDAFSYLGGGWYVNVRQVLPTWSAGDVFTFQIRVATFPPYASRSILWQEQDAIVSTSIPSNHNEHGVGMFIIPPEPSASALAVLGGAALWIFRRQDSARSATS
jgi:hypothetical protein